MKFETRAHAVQGLVDWFQENDIDPVQAVIIMLQLLRTMSEAHGELDGSLKVEIFEVVDNDPADEKKTSQEHVDQMINDALNLAERHK